ncbi:Ldh family oxidoreductase [Halovenus salina]|uniref:Ldh family oxidoreductase n=1 Tax=Halovenus salina TaxID=1510225 RepID=A0ABD5W5J8_9EURY|nr:Ldh family oxidoreductase [Halovenus salina]
MTTIDAERLEVFAASLLEELGAPADTAAKVAVSLVDADRTGHTSHGVLRIPTYGEMIADGVLVPDAEPAVEQSAGGTAVVDGGNAFGQLVGRRAVDILVERASEDGIAGVGIRNATHLGRIGEWAEQVADQKLCFLSFVHTSGGGLVVAPAGSTTRRFSTNPITAAVPTFDQLPFSLVLDMATSQVAHGKLDAAEADGKALPAEWAVTPEGEPLTDPSEMGSFREGDEWGAIRPLGGTTAGHKGTGLAVMAELFAGLLGGGPVAGQRDPQSWFNNGAFFIAIDPARFGDRDRMADQVQAFVEHFRAADSHPSVAAGDAAGSSPLLPGEAEYQTAQERAEDGIPLPERVVTQLTELADQYDIKHPFTDE